MSKPTESSKSETYRQALLYVIKAEEECKDRDFADMVLMNAADHCRQVLRESKEESE